MRTCGECTKCCEIPYGNVYGHEFGNGIACKFANECGCSIYRVRPEFCRSYYCAWAQELLPEEMRPDKCNVLVSVEIKNDKQFLRVVSTNENSINSDIILFLKNWSDKMNTPVIYQENGIWKDL
jgi:hypothetical protein